METHKSLDSSPRFSPSTALTEGSSIISAIQRS